MQAAPTIRVERAGEKLAIAPSSYLGNEFPSYLATLKNAGARFDAKTKRHLLEPAKLDALYSGLVRAGFNLENTEEVVDMLRSKAAAADESGNAVRRRAEGLGLFPYQLSGATWLAKRDRALLADDMGLGKTLQALIALPDNPAVLVVCPAAVKGVWRNETLRWRKDLDPIVLAGRGSFRWPERGQIVIVNYDILPEGIAPPTHPIAIIADEAHALKNYKAARAERFKGLATIVKKTGGRTWLLTGTPLLGRPFDLWGVLNAAGLGWDAYGSWQGFLTAFNGHPGKWGGYEFGQPRAEAAIGLERVSLRRRKTDVLPDLPRKTWQDLGVDVETGEAVEEVAAWLDDHEDAESIPFDMLSRARAELASAKIPAMLSIVDEYEEAEEPLVVFSAHRAPVLEFKGRDGWAFITGDQSPEERSEIVARFQAGKLKGVALTIAAGGVGLTLTHASNLLMVDREWTPALNVQAEDRVCRIGQTKPVLIKRLIADHKVDRRIAEVLDAKERLIQATVEAATTVDAAAVPATAAERSLDVATRSVPRAPAPGAPVSIVCARTAPVRRGPKDAVERWAAAGLAQLAATDQDKAHEQNGVGFSKLDGDFGHSLASQINRGLTDAQWRGAVRLATTYRRQVGEPPGT